MFVQFKHGHQTPSNQVRGKFKKNARNLNSWKFTNKISLREKSTNLCDRDLAQWNKPVSVIFSLDDPCETLHTSKSHYLRTFSKF